GDDLGGRRLAAFGVTAVVFGGQLNRMAEQFAAAVSDGDFNAALRVRAQGGHVAGDGQRRGDQDRVAGGDFDATQRVGAFHRCGFFSRCFFSRRFFFGRCFFFSRRFHGRFFGRRFGAAAGNQGQRSQKQ